MRVTVSVPTEYGNITERLRAAGFNISAIATDAWLAALGEPPGDVKRHRMKPSGPLVDPAATMCQACGVASPIVEWRQFDLLADDSETEHGDHIDGERVRVTIRSGSHAVDESVTLLGCPQCGTVRFERVWP